MYHELPTYGTDMWSLIRPGIDTVLIVGDAHDSDTNILNLLKSKRLVSRESDDLASCTILNGAQTLVLFAGDVLYKAPDSFMSVYSFILNNDATVKLCAGNNDLSL